MAAFAMASAAVAQTEAKDSAVAAKEAAKAKKVQDAANLKAFKEKQKAELAAFVKAQKEGTTVAFEKPAIANEDDEMAYFLGLMQSRGLKTYAEQQYGVDEAHLGKFTEGILSRANVDPNDKDATVFGYGEQIGGQVVQMAKQFSGDYYTPDEGKNVNPYLVAVGIVDGLLGKSTLSVDSITEVFQSRMEVRQAANKEKLYGPNREAGEKFLEENKEKPGVVCLASGLQYKILTQGTGEMPKVNQKVTVDYEGRLIDGTVFDSSYKRGKSATFGLSQVIKGWTEALQLMPVGSKWELYIPYQLAYGDQETGGEIKPYSALIFTVELKGIE